IDRRHRLDDRRDDALAVFRRILTVATTVMVNGTDNVDRSGLESSAHNQRRIGNEAAGANGGRASPEQSTLLIHRLRRREGLWERHPTVLPLRHSERVNERSVSSEHERLAKHRRRDQGRIAEVRNDPRGPRTIAVGRPRSGGQRDYRRRHKRVEDLELAAAGIVYQQSCTGKLTKAEDGAE